MSGEARLSRALAALAQDRALLAPDRAGQFGVFPRGDRRCRARAQVSAAQVRQLAADGAIVAGMAPETFVLARAGAHRAARNAAAPDEEYLAQHAPIGERRVVPPGGVTAMRARAADPHVGLARLARLTDAQGEAWFSAEEIEAARRLHADWERSQAGLVRGSDWSAPRRGGPAHDPGAAQERALAAGIDARRRVERALEALAPMLRRAVERVLFGEDGLEALERAENWPARSAKLVLKSAFAQLAAARA